MDDATYARIMDKLKSLGYDSTAFQKVPQRNE
jgi:hypothetical protein